MSNTQGVKHSQSSPVGFSMSTLCDGSSPLHCNCKIGCRIVYLSPASDNTETDDGVSGCSSNCDRVSKSDDSWESSVVKIEMDIAEEPPVFGMPEKDAQGQ